MHIWVFVARAIARRQSKICFIVSLLLVSFVVRAEGKEPSSKPAAAAESASFYELSSSWKDQRGNDFKWSDVKGQVALVSMVYTSCEHTCPMILSELSGLVKGLPESVQKKVQVLVISFDPERDTVERLAKVAVERKLDAQWRLLRGTKDDVDELAAVLNFRFKKLENGDFSHSNTISILDQKGRLIHQQTELFRERQKTLDVLKTLFK